MPEHVVTVGYDDPQAGAIRLGGVNLHDLEPAQLLRHVAVVFQDVYLFDNTIRANIATSGPAAATVAVPVSATVSGPSTRLSARPNNGRS